MRGQLTKLDLSSCKIGVDGAEIVADFLKHDEAVVRVWLHGCYIGPRGAKAIAKSLKHNRTVENLGLDHNKIGDVGAAALIDALIYNVCLKVLNFGRNRTDFTSERGATISNTILIPAAARRASLYLISARRAVAGAGILAIFPKEIVKMIAMEVWATRKSPKWFDALSV